MMTTIVLDRSNGVNVERGAVKVTLPLLFKKAPE